MAKKNFNLRGNKMPPTPPKKKQGIANYNQSKGKIPIRTSSAQQKLLSRRPVK